MLNRNNIWDCEYFYAQRQLFLFKLLEGEDVMICTKMWLCVQFTDPVLMKVLVFKNGFQVDAKTGRQLLQYAISTVTNPKDIQMVNLW